MLVEILQSPLMRSFLLVITLSHFSEALVSNRETGKISEIVVLIRFFCNWKSIDYLRTTVLLYKVFSSVFEVLDLFQEIHEAVKFYFQSVSNKLKTKIYRLIVQKIYFIFKWVSFNLWRSLVWMLRIKSNCSKFYYPWGLYEIENKLPQKLHNFTLQDFFINVLVSNFIDTKMKTRYHYYHKTKIAIIMGSV